MNQYTFTNLIKLIFLTKEGREQRENSTLSDLFSELKTYIKNKYDN